MKLKFTKMHGCGNDYVYINGFNERLPEKNRPKLVRFLSDRHFGIGSDGVIFINPSEKADFEMEMYNADGSRAEMCGNGIRSVAKYVFDNGLTDKRELLIESFGKIKPISIIKEKNGKALLIRVDMGEPELMPERISVISDKDSFINESVTVGNEEFRITAVSHAVIFKDPDGTAIDKEGPLIENLELFPKRTNVEFAHIIDRTNIRMRVWERGTGETLACGTGCCATLVAAVLNGLTDRKATIHVLGGDIDIEWREEDSHVYMTGPAETVFTGEIEV